MIAMRNLRQKLQWFQSIPWRKLLVGLIGIVLFMWGLNIINLVENSPHRRAHYQTSITYEPVLEKVLSDPEASMALDFAPIVLTIPESVEDPVHVELSIPLLPDVKPVPSNLAFIDIFYDLISRRGYNLFYLDGPSIQEFNKSVPGDHLGITLDGSQTYTATIRAFPENKRSPNEVEVVGKVTQQLSSQTPPLWAWTIHGLQRRLRAEQTQFDVVVIDQNGTLAGRATVTLTFFNPVGVWPLIPGLMLMAGVLLVFVGFGNLLNRPYDRALGTYLNGKGIQAVLHHHRFGYAALMWKFRQAQQEALTRQGQTSPFGQATTSSEFDPFQPIALFWLDRQAYVPATRAFRNRLQYQIMMNSRERIKQFQDLRSLTDDTKRKLRPAMRRLAHEMAKFDVRRETWRSYLWTLSVVLAYPLVIAFMINPLDAIVPAPVLQVLQLAYSRLLEANNIYAYLVIIVFFAIFGIMLLFIYFLPVFFPSFLIERWQNGKWRDHHPDAIIVDGLINVLHRAEKSPAQWASMGMKKDLTDKLETIAHTLERFLPHRLRTNDVGTDTLFQQRASEIAASMRDLKLWVLTPKADTRDRFIKHITILLEYALRSEWGAMPHMQSPSPLRPRLLLPKILNVVRTLVIAVLPLIIVALAIRFGFLQLDNTVTQYLGGGALVFAIISMMMAIDSEFSEKIDVIGKLKDTLFKKSDES